MADRWEIIARLGAGGQGEVFKARSPHAAKLREDAALSVFALLRNQVPPLAPPEAQANSNTIQAWGLKALPGILRTLVTDEDPASLGALKQFRIPDADPERSKAIHRLEQEIAALEEHKHPAILRLLEADAGAREIVTEYHPLGTLEEHKDRFRGEAGAALAALLPVVDAVAQLHRAGLVHRDVKLANLFLARDGGLVLGDFGIVFYTDAAGTRFTQTYERVGSREWMPPWVHTGRRLEDVPPSFDVFALGKVLWCMIAGETMLPYWYHDRPGFDLEERFPRRSEMAVVNAILRACVVEHEKDCHTSAEGLLGVMHEALRVVRRGGVMLQDGVDFACRLCARGMCKQLRPRGGSEDFKLPLSRMGDNPSHVQHLLTDALPVRIYRCDFCHNLEVFHFPGNQLPNGWVPSKS